MKVSEIMTRAVVVDAADDTLADAAAKMREQQTGSLLIMDGEKLLGIFTERDLLKAVAKGRDPKSTLLQDEMTTELVTISPNAKLREAASVMASKWIRHLPVVDGTMVLGVISQRDLTGLLDKLLDEPEHIDRLSEKELVRTRRIRRIEAGDLD
ncbi:MAG: cyclic nucleotide-binding/CBS domain-containing protein [Actinomycetota bacterium]|nr:CBS domain-containing protein [Actinomycetota bacterium]